MVALFLLSYLIGVILTFTGQTAFHTGPSDALDMFLNALFWPIYGLAIGGFVIMGLGFIAATGMALIGHFLLNGARRLLGVR